ncbi:MAG: glycosyltransferase, partial [Gammaproteobacteria bacterium]|nr:glycosyltransferase [Gammaproteobacteria bacterium]
MTIQAFLYDQIMQLSRNHSVTVIANCIEYSDLKILENNIVLRPVNIIREISPWNDLKAIYSLIKIFGKYKFDLVYSITPKAGLFAMFAGLLVRIPIRVHIFTGQVWVTKVGIKRFVLKSIDKRIAKFATHLLTDSASQMQFLVESKIANKRKIDVLANGSISG